MPSAFDRIDFGPPSDTGSVRAFGLALLIHAALIAALTWGVNWKHSDSEATFGAELWSNAPPDAAPVTPVTPAPVPPKPPEAPPLPQPVARPPVVQPPPEATPDVDIALEQEKKRKQLKDQKLAQEKIERDKAQLLKAEQLKADKLKAEQLKAEQLKAEKLKAEQLAKADKLKAEQLAKAEQAKADALTARQSQQAADKQREDNLTRLDQMMKSAGGAQGGSSSNRASVGGRGSSTTYSAIARAAVIPNVVFTEAFDGNPLAKVEVRLQSDGTIISSRVVQTSGNDNWDKAVLNAVIRTRVMPKDVDGKLPDTILILEFKPRL
jgi:colicin import membrane protein